MQLETADSATVQLSAADPQPEPAASSRMPQPSGSCSPSDGCGNIDNFINAIKLPVNDVIIRSPKGLQCSRYGWRSSKLADKPQAGRLEVQVKNGLLKKWGIQTPSAPTLRQAGAAARFSQTFRMPISSSKWEAMRELFPDRVRRAGRWALEY